MNNTIYNGVMILAYVLFVSLCAKWYMNQSNHTLSIPTSRFSWEKLISQHTMSCIANEDIQGMDNRFVPDIETSVEFLETFPDKLLKQQLLHFLQQTNVLDVTKQKVYEVYRTERDIGKSMRLHAGKWSEYDGHCHHDAIQISIGCGW